LFPVENSSILKLLLKHKKPAQRIKALQMTGQDRKAPKEH